MIRNWRGGAAIIGFDNDKMQQSWEFMCASCIEYSVGHVKLRKYVHNCHMRFMTYLVMWAWYWRHARVVTVVPRRVR